ncbi:MAG: hypothetical protein ACOY90_13885 [Candidatus Zhuqueibacterota bacterium]
MKLLMCSSMKKKKILFICGSLNQTTIMYKIYQHLRHYDCHFTPFYSDGYLNILARNGFLDFTILGGQARINTLKFLHENRLPLDDGGMGQNYDLVVTGSDLFIPKNIIGKKIVLVQEGMTDPENFKYYLVKNLHLPRYLANTSMTGLSDQYQTFCVASEGFKELFIQKGVRPDKIAVTGIPNFDNVKEHLQNGFQHRNYTLAVTSHLRETFKYENRIKFIENVVDIARGKQVIFKLHPGENVERASREINKYAPGSLIFTQGNTNEMVANCDVFVTRYSSVLLVALALNKQIYADVDFDLLKKLTPIQNGGKSARKIADICEYHLYPTTSFSKFMAI